MDAVLQLFYKMWNCLSMGSRPDSRWFHMIRVTVALSLCVNKVLQVLNTSRLIK